MDFDAVTLRDVVLAVIGLVGVYLVVMVLRLTQLRRRRAPAVEPTPIAPTIADEAEDAPEENLVYSPPPRAAAPQPAAVDFSTELTRSQQDSEIRQLREEVVQLREQVGQLRAELADVNAARLVSPQYSDAMAFAQRGLSAQDVADRCGISLGEAELVWALSRGAKNFDQEEEYGGEPGAEQPRAA